MDPWRQVLHEPRWDKNSVVHQITNRFRTLESENDAQARRVKLLVQTVDALSRTRGAMETHIEALQELCDVQENALADAQALLEVRDRRSVVRWPW
jgi:predicted  nucleic acid-binding Zn-ribbon protein